MVRLKSDKWYASENQHRLHRQAERQVRGSRRLVSLILLLGLVLMLMQKLNNPQVIENAFQSLGVPLDGQSVNESTVKPTDAASRPADSNAAHIPPEFDPKWDATCSHLIARILDRATPDEVNRLCETFFAIEPSATSTSELARLFDSANKVVSDARETMDRLQNIDSIWSENLDRFKRQWHELSKSPSQPEALDRQFLDAFSGELDLRLIGGLQDRAPWTATENTAFWRLLQRGAQFKFDDNSGLPNRLVHAEVATRALESEFDLFRNRWIRFRGSVRRVEAVERSRAEFGVEKYWLLWLRGSDGADQPVAVYTTDALAPNLEASIHDDSFPNIEVVGIVAKRLAYSSQSGIQVAPTLFAGSIKRLAETSTENSPVPASTLTEYEELTPPWARQSQVEMHGTLAGIAENQLKGMFDADCIREFEQLARRERTPAPDVVLKTLHALGQIGWLRLMDADVAINSGNGWRLDPIEVHGWVRRADPHKLSNLQQDWFSIETTHAIFTLTFDIDQDEPEKSPSLVICQSVPKIWQESLELCQPARIYGYALSSPEIPMRVIFSDSPEWVFIDPPSKNQRPALVPAIKPSWSAIASKGWNLSWFDLLESQNKKPLDAAETQPLLSLLAISHRESLEPLGPSVTAFPDILKNPNEHLGDAIDWKVRLVRGSRVELNSSESKVDTNTQYFQYDGFVSVPGQTVRYVIPNSKDELIFEGEFPVTLLMASASDFVPQNALNSGEISWSVGRHARAKGRFYRLWSYQSEKVESLGRHLWAESEATARQVAPLIVVGSLEPAWPDPLPPSPVDWFAYAMAGAIALLLGVILIFSLKDFLGRKS